MNGTDLIAGILKLEAIVYIPTLARADIIDAAAGVARHAGPTGLPRCRALARFFNQTGSRSL